MDPTSKKQNTPWKENPFFVLGLPPHASAAEIEREGQKLLSMLALGISSALHYPTPLGPQTRTQELVRQAMAELRDPNRRLEHELWAHIDPKLPIHPPIDSEPFPPTWPEAFSALGLIFSGK